MRIVAKENFSRDLADSLLDAFKTELSILANGTPSDPSSHGQSFHH
jgi:hypothetical protein